MQEDEQNAEYGLTKRIMKRKTENNLPSHRAPIRKLITHYLLRYTPNQEQTGDNRSKRHQQLRREIVTIGQEILTEESQSWNCYLEKENRIRQ